MDLKFNGLIAGDLMECRFYDKSFTLGFVRGTEWMRLPNGDKKQHFRGDRRTAIDFACFMGGLFGLYPSPEERKDKKRKDKNRCYYRFFPRG